MRKVRNVNHTPSTGIRIFFESVTFSFQIQNCPRPHVIVADLLFSSVESELKKIIIRIRPMRVYEAVSGRKKLWIKNSRIRGQHLIGRCGKTGVLKVGESS